MRILLVVTAILLLALPAFAQGMSGGQGVSGGKRQNGRATHQMSEAEKQKRKADDAAYKAALDKIPNQSKADPWRNAR
jgi:hypothetical protein